MRVGARLRVLVTLALLVFVREKVACEEAPGELLMEGVADDEAEAVALAVGEAVGSRL